MVINNLKSIGSSMPMNLQLFAEGGEVSSIDTSVNNTEVADQSTNDDSVSDISESTVKTEVDNAGQPAKQSDEENAKYAKARREAEAEAEAIKTQAKKDREIAKKYGATYGVYSEEDIKNAYGASHNIKSLEDFEARLKEEEYRQKGIDPDVIKDIVSNHPDIKKAQELAKQAQAQENIRNAISELNAEYGLDLKTGDDLDKLPNQEKIAEYVRKGLSIADSYYLANRKDIESGKLASAKQAAINSINSKDHLKPTGEGTDIHTVKIDSEEMKYWKGFFPNWSEKQIREYISKQ